MGASALRVVHLRACCPVKGGKRKRGEGAGWRRGAGATGGGAPERRGDGAAGLAGAEGAGAGGGGGRRGAGAPGRRGGGAGWRRGRRGAGATGRRGWLAPRAPGRRVVAVLLSGSTVCTGFSSSWHKGGLKDGFYDWFGRQGLLPFVKGLVDWVLTECEVRTTVQTSLSRPICATNSKIPCKRHARQRGEGLPLPACLRPRRQAAWPPPPMYSPLLLLHFFGQRARQRCPRSAWGGQSKMRVMGSYLLTHDVYERVAE